MLTISDNNISLTRGDTASLEISALMGAQARLFAADDVLAFTVRDPKNNQPGGWLFQVAGIPIEANESGKAQAMEVRIEPHHTGGLEFGTYLYDAELRIGGSENEVNTLLVGEFRVTQEVNY